MRQNMRRICIRISKNFTWESAEWYRDLKNSRNPSKLLQLGRNFLNARINATRLSLARSTHPQACGASQGYVRHTVNRYSYRIAPMRKETLAAVAF